MPIDSESISALARHLADAVGEPDNPLALLGFTQSIRAEIDRRRLGIPLMPGHGESVALTLGSFKTSALAFDRVWMPPAIQPDAPDEVRAYGATLSELWILVINAFLVDHRDALPRLLELRDDTPLRNLDGTKPTARALSEMIHAGAGILCVPIYEERHACEADYQPGKYEVVVGSLAGARVVDEDRLQWGQVLELRRDAAAREKYRRFIHWLDVEFVGKSQEFIQDELCQRMSDYDEALRKHGIETVIGTLDSVIDPKFIGGLSALVAGLTYGVGISGAVASAATITLGRVACSLARSLVAINDARTGRSSPLAFVYDLKRLSSQGAG